MYCQKCRTPLKLDGSLEDLNPAAYDLLVAASSTSTPSSHTTSPSRLTFPQEEQRKALYEKASRNASTPLFRRSGASALHPSQRDAAMSFIYLTESQVVPGPAALPMPTRGSQNTQISWKSGTQNTSPDSDAPGESTKSHDLERVDRLFEILSARSDIDHPICIECTDLLVDGLQKKLEATNRERDAYVSFLKQLQADKPSEEDMRAQEETLRRAKKEEAEALADLVRLEAEKVAVDEELFALEEEARELDREEENFWRERNAFTTRLADFQNERDSINSKFDHDSQLLEKLQRSNVYNDTFCISHDGTFATINGLRLGRLSSRTVEWAEINAAWGHALLLLVTVAEKLEYRFVGFEPLPMGSTSKITRIETASPTSSRLHIGGNRSGNAAPPPAPKRTALELYSSGDAPLGLTFVHRKLNQAMVAFLELVRQLGVFVHQQTERSGRPLQLPYAIDGDKIGDVSIRLGSQDEAWTKACKLTLTCCKFLLAHASNLNSPTRTRTSEGR